MTNSKVRDIFEKKLAKLSVFESFKTFFSSDHFFFQEKPNSESFENSRAVNTLVHILDEISHVHCFFKFFEDVLSTFYHFCRKKTSFERFENSCAKIQLEMQSVKDLPKLAIFEKSSFFYEGKHYFSKKVQILNVLSLHQQKKFLKSILKERIHV